MAAETRRGYYGDFGGRFVAETLVPALEELERAFSEHVLSPEFQREWRGLLSSYVVDEFILARRKEKRINDQISEALCTTFVTALEREDIEALSVALYKIPKTIEKIGERILLAPHFLKNFDLTRQVLMLEKATDTVVKMIQELRRGVNLEGIKSFNDQLQVVEGEGDKLILEHLRTLYSGQHDAVKVVFMKDIFELLEKVLDRCRDAGNVINHIVLKNS
jgi:uncharacterized protein Yka (UPF0111/DUF47 family)